MYFENQSIGFSAFDILIEASKAVYFWMEVLEHNYPLYSYKMNS